MSQRLGLAIKDMPLRELATVAAAAEQAGVTDLLLPEIGPLGPPVEVTGRDPVLAAAAALRATSVLRAGPGVAAAVVRPARVLAVQAATVQEESGVAGTAGTTTLLVRSGPPDALAADAASYHDRLPNYRRHFERQGLRGTDAVTAGTCLPDDPGAAAAGLAGYADAGVDVPCLYPCGLDAAQVVALVAGVGARVAR